MRLRLGEVPGTAPHKSRISLRRMSSSTPTSTTHRAAIPFPAIVITLRPERTCAPLKAALRSLVPRLRCLRATRKADVAMGPINGTAHLPINANTRARLLFHHPPVHPTVFNVGALEVAILVSHLRALVRGLESTASDEPFLVFEEDAEWAMLLASPHDAIANLLASLSNKWSVIQAAVIAEAPYMRHLQRRLSSSASSSGGRHHRRRRSSATTTSFVAPTAPRATLRGLSWPFTPGRAVIENRTWLKPYWSAAAYAVSPRGATTLLDTYWPNWRAVQNTHSKKKSRRASQPSLEVTIDTTSQLWPAADQLLFNLSGSYITTPILTQPVSGSHVEHTKYKRGAR